MSKSSRKGSPTPTSEASALGHEEEEVDCPLCLEEMDGSDCRFKPCPCGYQICRFCWHRIREEGNERCPACRRIYTDEDIEFLPEPQVPVRPSKGRTGRRSGGESTTATSGTSTGASTAAAAAAAATSSTVTSSTMVPAGVIPSRRHLVDIRVIQKNLVYVIGISARIAHEHILKEAEYFGQFGRIVKIVVNRRNTGAPLPPSATAGSGGTATTTSGSAYVTYGRAEEAARAIAYVDGSVFDGRILRATYGTTKYCSFFLRGVTCPNTGCMYLHEEGDQAASYTKEELSAGKLHLHSNLVDKTEEAAHRQFGTIMYHPPSRREAPASAITSTTVSSGRSSANQSPITNPSPPPASQSQGPTVEPPQPMASPINLALYEEEAVSFLNRLSRWNPAIDFDIQAEEPQHQQQQQQPPRLATQRGAVQSNFLPSTQFTGHHHRGHEGEHHHHHHTGDHFQFDPFAAEAAATGTSLAQHRLGLNYSSPQYYQVPAHLPTGSGAGMAAGAGAVRSPGATPMISRGGGALLGFNWGGARAGGARGEEEPSLTRADSVRNLSARDASPSSSLPSHHMIRPAPVGSPVGPLRSASSELSPSSGLTLPGQHSQTQSVQQLHAYAAPAPLAPANLDEIFGFYGSQSLSSVTSTATATAVPLASLQRQQAPRKILDASLLERQFFHSDQGLLAGGTGGASETGTPGLPVTEQPVKFNQVAATPVSPIITGPSSVVNGAVVGATASSPPVTGAAAILGVTKTATMTIPTTTTAVTAPKSTIKILKREGRELGAGRETAQTSVAATASSFANREVAGPPSKDISGGPRKPVTILTKDRSAANSPSAKHPSAAMTISSGISLASPLISKSNVFAALLEDADEDEDEAEEQQENAEQEEEDTTDSAYGKGERVKEKEKEKEKGRGREKERGGERETKGNKEVGTGEEKRDRGLEREGPKRGISTTESTHRGDTVVCEATKVAGETSINTSSPSSTASGEMKQSVDKGELSSVKPASGTLPAVNALTMGGAKKKKQKKMGDPSEPKIIVRPSLPKLASQPDYTFIAPSWTNNFAITQPPSLELMSEEERTAWRRWLEEDLKCTRLEEQQLRAKVIKLYEDSIQWINSMGLAPAS